jgi:pimeloyl-ACP methyl ester carboxylesterase
VSTVILHGEFDFLLPIKYGEDTADNIPGAKLRVVKIMATPPRIHGSV